MIPATPYSRRYFEKCNLRGKGLQGKPILAVPVQEGAIPHAVLDAAAKGKPPATIRAMWQPLAERTAKRRYEGGGKWFSAVIGDVSEPDCVLEVNPQSPYRITVKFFDGHGSARLSYGFWLMEPGKLFLKHVVRWEYPEDGRFHSMNEATLVEDLFWEKPDGVVRRESHQGNSVSAEDYRDVPSDANWEPYPVFGDFASIAREDRDQPSGQA